MTSFDSIVVFFQSHKDRLVALFNRKRKVFFRRAQDIPTEPPTPPRHRARGPATPAAVQASNPTNTKKDIKDSESDLGNAEDSKDFKKDSKDTKKDSKDIKKVPKGPK